MESLRLLLVRNHSYLGKLRARALYCASAVTTVETDFHKQYGPFCGYWDEWFVQAAELKEEICENILLTSAFLAELQEFIISLDKKKKLTKNDRSYLVEVISLAEDKLNEQRELIKEIDKNIVIHRKLTKKLLLVEAIDGLGDE